MRPTGKARTTRSYRGHSFVLETIHETDTGTVRVIDLLPLGDGRADILRRVEGVSGTVEMEHEWVVLANLFCLLMGFALLSRHFEESKVPDVMPAYLPGNWKGGFMLLVLVFVLSSFLDNIAAALIGGTVARHVFKGKVGIGYLAAIVAACGRIVNSIPDVLAAGPGIRTTLDLPLPTGRGTYSPPG